MHSSVNTSPLVLTNIWFKHSSPTELFSRRHLDIIETFPPASVLFFFDTVGLRRGVKSGETRPSPLCLGAAHTPQQLTADGHNDF